MLRELTHSVSSFASPLEWAQYSQKHGRDASSDIGTSDCVWDEGDAQGKRQHASTPSSLGHTSNSGVLLQDGCMAKHENTRTQSELPSDQRLMFDGREQDGRVAQRLRAERHLEQACF